MIPLNTPRDSATLWSTYTFAKKYEIGGGVDLSSASATPTTPTPIVVPEFIRFDATAAYKQPKYDIRLNVFNLLNAYYYDAGHRVGRRPRACRARASRRCSR